MGSYVLDHAEVPECLPVWVANTAMELERVLCLA